MKSLPFKISRGHNPYLEELLNDMLAQIRAQKPRGSSNVKCSETANGTIIEAGPRGPGGTTPAASLTPFLYVKQYANYVIGQNQITGQLTQIAKPFKNRCNIGSETIDGTVWSISYPIIAGGTSPSYVSRLKSSGGYSEYQRITPAWGTNLAEVIYAIQVTPNAGVSSESGDNITPVNTPITWIDLNLDARTWASTPDGLP